MALSSDSSCTQNLENSTSGYETLILSKSTNQKKVPNFVQENVATWVRLIILRQFQLRIVTDTIIEQKYRKINYD